MKLEVGENYKSYKYLYKNYRFKTLVPHFKDVRLYRGICVDFEGSCSIDDVQDKIKFIDNILESDILKEIYNI